MEGMGPHGGGVEGEAAEEPGRVEWASVVGWEGTRRSEKAKVSEEALLIGGSEAERPLNVGSILALNHEHQTHNNAAYGWRMH